MKRTIGPALVGLALLLGPTDVFAGGVTIRGGGFLPQAESNLFADTNELYGVRKKDWRGFTGGAGFDAHVGSNIEISFDIDGYVREKDTAYRDFVNDNGSEIFQTLKLTIVPVGVSVKLAPGGRRHHGLTPYAGVGVDLFFWEYEEFGEFIDFFDPDLAIDSDAFRSEGVTPGFHVLGGLRVPITHDLQIVGEGKYQFAKTNMGDDFRQNKLDLGGATVTIGVRLDF